MDWDRHLKSLWTIADRLKDQDLRESLTRLERDVLADEKSRLNQQGELGKDLKYSPPAYWKVQGGKKDGPFCQVCWDTSHRLIRLQSETSSQMVCKVCGNRFGHEESSPFTFNPAF